MPGPLPLLFERYTRLFFEGENLQKMLTYMCNACTMEITDPIPTTLTMFLTSNITLALTKVGLMPFKDMPMAIYPYARMTNEQKQLLLEYTDAIEREQAGSISTQMGGGCVLALTKKACPVHYLNDADVLSVFCQTVMTHESHTCEKTRLAICNIVLQRLSVNVGIARETMQKIYASLGKADRDRKDNEIMEVKSFTKSTE